MKTVEFFLYDNADGLDIMGPLEVFTIATQLFERKNISNKGYRVIFSADRAGQITLGSGLKIHAEKRVGHGQPTDIFIVPGGIGADKVCENRKLVDRIASKARKSKRTVSICTGAFILAECGLLNGKTCTTHWFRAEQLAKQYPETNVDMNAIYIKDGKIYTSAGITTGIDLALALLEKDYGLSISMEVARMMVLYLRRPGRQSQFSAPLELRGKAGKEFSALHDWILENIDSPLLVEDLADHVAMSPRNFARMFTDKTGVTPGKYVELIRLSKARELLESSSQTVDIIAKISGFQREERLRRVFFRNPRDHTITVPYPL